MTPIEYNKLYDLLMEVNRKLDERPIQSINKTELNTALAKAQGEMEFAQKSSNNPFFKSKYADLKAVVAAARPSLSKYGLSVKFETRKSPDGQLMLYTILKHSNGVEECSEMPILPPKNDIQSIRSYCTQLKRLQYEMITGVVACDEEDDDGESLVAPTRGQYQRPESITPVHTTDTFVTISKDQHEMLTNVLDGYPSVAERLLTQMNINSLADIPKVKFQAIFNRAQEIISTQNAGKVKGV